MEEWYWEAFLEHIGQGLEDGYQVSMEECVRCPPHITIGQHIMPQYSIEISLSITIQVQVLSITIQVIIIQGIIIHTNDCNRDNDDLKK